MVVDSSFHNVVDKWLLEVYLLVQIGKERGSMIWHSQIKRDRWLRLRVELIREKVVLGYY